MYKQPHEVESGRAGSVQRKAAQTRKWTEINKDLAYEFTKSWKNFEKYSYCFFSPLYFK